ncbi:hypothetical protein I317_01952 [Kwoniella heveanensis CBS 569]|nr:hypothetical protein I317_01952 [Kwoniella heveanensis CBS 569]
MDATRSIEARDDAEELESGHRRKRRRTKGVSACTAFLGTWCSIANHRASPPIQADVNRFCSTAERTQHRDKDEAVHTPNSNTASVNQSSLSELLERIKRIEAATQVLMMDQSSGLILNFLPRASTSNAGRLDLPNQPDDQSDSHSTHPSQPDESPIIHSASSLIGGMYGLIPNEPLANPVAAGLTTDALLRVAYDRFFLSQG